MPKSTLAIVYIARAFGSPSASIQRTLQFTQPHSIIILLIITQLGKGELLMTLDEYMDLLTKIDNKYATFEDKNYYLIHKMVEIFPSLNNEQIEQIKDEIIKNILTNNIHPL